MAIVLFILMAAILIVVDYFFRSRVNRVAAEDKKYSFIDIEGVKLESNTVYHPMHTWARKEDARTVRIGLDDYGRRLIGASEKITLPVIGMNLESGQTCVKVRNGNKTVTLLTPLSGEVIEINNKLKSDPKLIYEDPYGEGWLFRIRNWSVLDQLKSLLTGEIAREWLKASINRLRSSYAMEAGVTAQDGGQICEDVGKHLEKYEWIKLVRETFGTEPTVEE